MSDQEEELLNYLRALVAKSQGGQIPWRKVNPTTFSASVAAANAKMVLQTVLKPASTALKREVINGMPRNVRVEVPASQAFVFQLIEGATGNPLISLNAESSSTTFVILGELFQTVSALDNKRGLDLLKKVVS